MQFNLFVPGRLALLGEHSDWAAGYRRINPTISKGAAIVVGTNEGIHAKVTAKEEKVFTIFSSSSTFSCPLMETQLLSHASEGGYYSYVAGVVAVLLQHHNIGGLTIEILNVTLPMKKGLSSSAAICVLVARAYNQAYNLNLTIRGECEIAYKGEIATPSQCGRLDQAGCGFGSIPVLVEFDGDFINISKLIVKEDVHLVFADIKAGKNTHKILSDLNKSYPFPNSEKDFDIHSALGAENLKNVQDTVVALAEGNIMELGHIFARAQKLFDSKVAPCCPEELTSPKLHQIITDVGINASEFIFGGGKGVGSQGDGTVLFVSRGAKEQMKLIEYLSEKWKLYDSAFALTIPKQKTIKSAIIPIAGQGTRMQPASLIVRKDFLPVLDVDGMIKPTIFIQLEELHKSGIDRICLIVKSKKDEEEFKRIFETSRHTAANDKIREYMNNIFEISKKITYVIQYESLGFGHAVYQAEKFVGKESVLLLLGDHLFRHNDKITEMTCTQQIVDAFTRGGGDKTTVLIEEVDAIEDVVHYGIVSGKFNESSTNTSDDDDDDDDLFDANGCEKVINRVIKVDKIVEKPSVDDAKRLSLGIRIAVKDKQEDLTKYFCIFGMYILTPTVFECLRENIASGFKQRGEYQLTTALHQTLEKEGMIAMIPAGKRFDVGLPDKFAETCYTFSRYYNSIHATDEGNGDSTINNNNNNTKICDNLNKKRKL